tara:strand:- start:141 stop:500 length:360 start_codon:yes stop_codon:yes gene_type:complete
MYDENNIFAKIIRKEIPCEFIYEDDKVLFFNDINPQAKIHILAIPKDKVINFREFISITDEKNIKYFFNKINEIIINLGLDKTGYRLITNDGKDSNQEVPHFHVHILGGENLGGLKNIS